MSGADEGYGDNHRAFLQAFMARGTMTFEDAQPVLAAIDSVAEGREVLPQDITQTELNTYINTANTAISSLDLQIRSTVDQKSQSRVYALINTTSDPIMQLATTYSADEIAYVKRLLDVMFENNNTPRAEIMAIASMQAIQLARIPTNRRQSGEASQSGSAQPLSMKDAETVLKHLVQEGWFEKSRKEYYSLTPRALMELRGWLIDTYNYDDDDDEDTLRINKIKLCFACKEIITVGQRCSNNQCPGRLHAHCTARFFRLQQEEKCPVCKSDWTGEHLVGEAAASQGAQARSRPSERS
ncbi:hypothetical protein FQN57_001468 [Myotisia sp. PD_48]|nr:hypothetical protein FQN57_001468 [Myotisia sp. PD_48]